MTTPSSSMSVSVRPSDLNHTGIGQVAPLNYSFDETGFFVIPFVSTFVSESQPPPSDFFLGEQGGVYHSSPYGITDLHSGRYYYRYQNDYIDGQTGNYYQAVPGGHFFDSHNGRYVKPE